MNFSELVKIRQSDRKYSSQPIEKEKLIQCLETARLSPSANNAQPWKFIVVDNPELKNNIAECAASLGMNKFANQAPVIIVVIDEKPDVATRIAQVVKDKSYSQLDIGIAVNQLCLQAADLNLGTCIIGWFNERKIKKLLGINRSKRVRLLITIGYSLSDNRQKIRKSFDDVCSWNKY